MPFHWNAHPKAPPASAAAPQDEHTSIKKIGRLVLICAGVLFISAVLLVFTAVQVMRTIDQADVEQGRLRAANAIDAMAERDGPLTPDSVALLGRIAGLEQAHLSMTVSTDPGIQQIPLLGDQGPSGSLLTWTHNSSVEALVRQFIPLRMPIIATMLAVVLGLLVRLRVLVGDIERQRRLAHRQSRSDVVTGLPNRLAFETALHRLASGSLPFAIILFDLDHFKHINDCFGHAAGDIVLRTVGTRLSSLLNSGDLLARLGGDEFVMLCTTRTSREAVSVLAQQCIAAAEQPMQLDGTEMKIGISMGLVAGDANGLPPSIIVDAADAALYRAKAMSGSSFCFAGDDSPPSKTVITQFLRASA